MLNLNETKQLLSIGYSCRGSRYHVAANHGAHSDSVKLSLGSPTDLLATS
jgi:hypothetical protein